MEYSWLSYWYIQFPVSSQLRIFHIHTWKTSWDIMVTLDMLNTLRPRQMAAISQTTFSNAFSWMKMNEFCLWFHWSLFLRFELTIFQHWFRKWLGASQATSRYLNQGWLVYWHIYASLCLNELSQYTNDSQINYHIFYTCIMITKM